MPEETFNFSDNNDTVQQLRPKNGRSKNRLKEVDYSNISLQMIRDNKNKFNSQTRPNMSSIGIMPPTKNTIM